MSGGSYDYLCFMEFDKIIDNLDLLDKMAERLIELGYIAAAMETYKAKNEVEAAMVRYEAHKERLENLWRAVEWYDSGDWGLEDAKEAYIEYAEGEG